MSYNIIVRLRERKIVFNWECEIHFTNNYMLTRGCNSADDTFYSAKTNRTAILLQTRRRQVLTPHEYKEAGTGRASLRNKRDRPC